MREGHKTVEAQRRAFAESGTRAFEAQPDYIQGGRGWEGPQGNGGACRAGP